LFEKKISGDTRGWCLIEVRLSTYKPHYRARLRGKSESGVDGVYEYSLPILRHGRIHELICLPCDISDLCWLLPEAEPHVLSIQRVGWLERVVRMANRVFTAIRRLPREQRKALGLTYLNALTGLAQSYRAASIMRASLTYSDWITQFDQLKPLEFHRISNQIIHLKRKPRFYLVLVADDSSEAKIRQTLDSIDAQIYRNHACTTLMLSDFMSQSASPHENGTAAQGLLIKHLEKMKAEFSSSHEGEWLLLLRAGKRLPPYALYWLASEVSAKPDAAIIYADDDEQDALGQRCRPRFKPDWSLAHLRSTNFVGDAVALRGDVVASAGGLDPDCFRFGNYDLLLRVVDAIGEDRDKIVHIPAVLLHTGIAGDMTAEMRAWNMAALRAHLVRNGVSGEVSETLPGCWRVRYRLPESPPLVSIIVPTRDRLELIQRCLESVLEKTTYPRYEILVVDNQSADPEVLAFLDRMGKHEQVRVLRYDRSFNFSAMNNLAVEQAKGEVVCLLNNDTEVISPDWLDEMIGHLLQSKVGVVGAKLYFPDGRVQHAGDLVGVGGVANHAHAFLQSNEPGYCNRAMVAQDMSAVTAACMVTRRSLYLELGGLDEKNLPVAFNDVDYCLRASEAGYRVVWTPYAELYHHESVSRGKDLTPEKKKRAKSEVVYMRKRWRRVMRNDPYYNPNLSYERPDFSLSHAPMVKKPWVNGK